MTKKTPEAIVALYRGGMSLRTLARVAGVAKETIRRLLLAHGEPLRRRGGNQGPHSRHRI